MLCQKNTFFAAPRYPAIAAKMWHLCPQILTERLLLPRASTPDVSRSARGAWACWCEDAWAKEAELNLPCGFFFGYPSWVSIFLTLFIHPMGKDCGLLRRGNWHEDQDHPQNSLLSVNLRGFLNGLITWNPPTSCPFFFVLVKKPQVWLVQSPKVMRSVRQMGLTAETMRPP